jgi:tetratricopeptide (TPR) repeat protein
MVAWAIIIASLLIGGAAQAKEDPVNMLLARAEEQIMKTDSRDAALELIEIYESVLDLDPENYEALWSLARYNILVGVAYTEDRKEKKKYYTTAVDYSIKAMRTNPDFRARLDKGEKPWNACDCLGKGEIEALFYWYNGNGLISKECQSRMQQILYGYRLPRYKKVMTRLIEIDPEWAGGHPYFAWAGYYAAIPEMMGQDLDLAEEYFDKAEAAGPNWIYIKYSKAVLLHTARGDREAFIKDLEWVLAQDPKEADSPYPFNVYFQREAKEMLENIDDYFN